MSGWLSGLLRRLRDAWRALLGAAAAEALGSSARSRGLLGRAPDEVIGGRFELERLAGQGGMGKVYRARDALTGDPVAVKVLHLDDRESLLRFEREASLLAELDHPGVVRYVAHGFTDEGTPYLAMEWLEGEDLADHLRENELEVAQSVALVGRLAQTLGEAHRRGVVHRDVKPSNVFFVGRSIERPKLLDFGIARVGGEGRPLTATGATIGTPGYMAPEQARGEPGVGPRADVFSLGCVLYECLSGQRPFAADDVMGVLLKVVLEEPPPLGELRDGIPAALERLVGLMLAKTPDERPADGAGVARALAALDLDANPRLGAGEGNAPDRPSSLGAAEQRLLCVAVARARQRAIEPRDRGALRDAVQRAGGRLDVLVDGSFLVTASAAAANDQAVVAARCARALRAAVPEIAIAVVAGRAEVTGRIPVGDVIERGVRLVSEADGSATRVDDVVAGLLLGRFEVLSDASGATLGAELSEGDLPRTLLGKATPFVGRERETAALEGLFDECLGEPVARAALIRAPAGVGKSRLVRETLDRIRAKAETAEVWIGRGSSLGAGSPFGLVAPAIRRTAGVLDGEAPEVRRQKLAARVGRDVAPANRTRVAEFIGEMAGVPFPDEPSEQLRAARRDPVLMNDQIGRAWCDLLAAETAARPLVLVLEDMHWGDAPSVGLVDAALRALPDAPIFVLATARPEVDSAFPQLWAAREPLEIRLHELTRKSSERLVRKVLGDGAADSVVERLVERAAGNAFYLEELIRASADGSGDAMPETVLGMVQARLAALDPEVRRTLRAAAVFGDVFWRGGVEVLLGGTPSSAPLDDLIAAEHVVRRPAAKFKGEQELAFRHALIREAAYAMLTDSDRTIGHRLAGDWLEARGESEAVVVAEHFERGGEPSRAVAWYQRAARAALAGNDLPAALSRAARGLACLGPASAAETGGAASRDGDAAKIRGMLHLIQAEAFRWRGEHAETRVRAHEAIRWLPRGTADWYDAIGAAAMTCTRLDDQGLDAIVTALETVAPDDAAFGSYAVAMARTAGACAVTGRRTTYRDIIERAQAIPRDRIAADPAALAQWSVSQAFRALYTGNPGDYLAMLETAVKSFERAGDERSGCQHRVNMGDAFLELGAFERAELVLREGAVDAERRGLAVVAAFARHSLALAYARLGRLDEAEAAARHAIAVHREQRDRRLEGVSHTYLSMIAALRPSWDDAEREARTAVELLAPSRPFQLHALAVLAGALLGRGEATAAVEAAREAFEGLQELGRGIEEGESCVRLAFAEALHASGDEEGACAAIERARARLLERADRIQEPWRTSFLENIAENARTLELAARLAKPPG